MARGERKADAPVRVLRPGESSLLGRHIDELEIVLFRPLHSESSPWQMSMANTLTLKHAKSSVAGSPPGFDPTSRRGTAARESSASTAVAAATESAGPFPSAREDCVSTAGKPPLFFDTTACVFYDDLQTTDYVTTGRSATDTKGLVLRPHMVVLGDEPTPSGYCTYNIDVAMMGGTASREDVNGYGANAADYRDDNRYFSNQEAVAVNNGVTMAAGDGVDINFRKLSLCSGVLVCASLFTKETTMFDNPNVYYMVRKPKSPVPVCLVPISVPDECYNSSVAVMLRRVKLRGELIWELSNVSEPLEQKNVKSIVFSLEGRGLKDPLRYQPDFDVRDMDGPDDTDLDDHDDMFTDDDEADEESEDSADEAPASPCDFVELLANVPKVTREGRRQYNVGRPHIRGAAHANDSDDESSGDDGVLDDAMRAVMPRFDNTRLVRYEDGTYNVGSRAEALVSHYADHREEYGIDNVLAAAWSGRGESTGAVAGSLPPLSSAKQGGTPFDVQGLDPWNAHAASDRCRTDSVDQQHPLLPPEFMEATPAPKDSRKNRRGSHVRRGTVSVAKKTNAPSPRHSTGERARSSSAKKKGQGATAKNLAAKDKPARKVSKGHSSSAEMRTSVSPGPAAPKGRGRSSSKTSRSAASTSGSVRAAAK